MKDLQDMFVCQRCGFCCHGETTVSLDQKDLDNMLKTLKIDQGAAFRNYLRKEENVIQMQVVDGHCIFYKEGCTVHEGRPWRCAQWPLHPAILIDESNFETIKDSCPGINRDLSYGEFCRQLSQFISSDK